MPGLDPAGTVDDDKPGDALGVDESDAGGGASMFRGVPGGGNSVGGFGLGRGETPMGDLPALATALAIARSRFSFCSFSRFFLVPFFNFCFLPLPRTIPAPPEAGFKAAAASSGVGKSGSSRSMTPHPPPASWRKCGGSTVPGCRRAPRLSGATRVKWPWWRWTCVRYGASSLAPPPPPWWPGFRAADAGKERLEEDAAPPPSAATLGEGFCTLRVHAGPEWVPPCPGPEREGEAGGVAMPLRSALLSLAPLAVYAV